MELKKGKALSGEDYAWTDYMCLPFTQNVGSSLNMRHCEVEWKVFQIINVIGHLLFLKQVINETLRMANIINAVWRKAVKDVKIKGE